jgi:hypothetical protein
MTRFTDRKAFRRFRLMSVLCDQQPLVDRAAARQIEPSGHRGCGLADTCNEDFARDLDSVAENRQIVFEAVRLARDRCRWIDGFQGGVEEFENEVLGLCHSNSALVTCGIRTRFSA